MGRPVVSIVRRRLSVLLVPRHHDRKRERAAQLARYATRVVLGGGKVRRVGGGRVVVETPPDPRTGSTSLDLDELELVHALCPQVPPPGMHLVRYFGVYANRLRRRYREARAALAGESRSTPITDSDAAAPSLGEEHPPAPPGSAEALRRQAGARLLRRVFEVDPLRCPRCGGGRVVLAWITEPETVDRIRRHRHERGLWSVFDTPQARAPPAP